jgi:HNH endonuclease
VARAVWQRDGGRCSYVDGRGQRCRERSLLEYHHVQAFALGGATTLDNLTLRCRAHNALAAEQEFGVAHVARARCGESDCTSPT